jgi:hypothetical protein
LQEGFIDVAGVGPAVELADFFADPFSDYLKEAHCAAVNAFLRCRTALGQVSSLKMP